MSGQFNGGDSSLEISLDDSRQYQVEILSY